MLDTQITVNRDNLIGLFESRSIGDGPRISKGLDENANLRNFEITHEDPDTPTLL